VPTGETAQFQAIASQSDGSKRDVTAEASWESSNAKVLQVTAGGIATGVSSGMAVAYSRFEGKVGRHEVLVLPRGTYRLMGRVLESGLPITGATVSVIAGRAAGLSATTDSDGGYALYGVVDEIQIRASKEGYESQVQSILVQAEQTFDFDLAPLERAEIGGDYVLRITAAPCASDFSTGILPDEAMDRAYEASVIQDGPRVSVSLRGAILFGKSKFEGRVSPEGVSFTLYGPADFYYGYYGVKGNPDLGERLSASRFLITSGNVKAKSTVEGVTGVLDGLLRVSEGQFPPGTTVADCWSKGHQFVMTRS
jgi:hypothetical protein